MRKTLAVLFLASFATATVAQVDSGSSRHYFRPNTDHQGVESSGSHGSGDEPLLFGGLNLTYHSGGEVIVSAKAVLIFWGPNFQCCRPGESVGIRSSGRGGGMCP
jgi:hypothetical protein